VAGRQADFQHFQFGAAALRARHVLFYILRLEELGRHRRRHGAHRGRGAQDLPCWRRQPEGRRQPAGERRAAGSWPDGERRGQRPAHDRHVEEPMLARQRAGNKGLDLTPLVLDACQQIVPRVSCCDSHDGHVR
jgi:hypothetical protein